MNADNTTKLVKRFPVLFQNFYSPMSETCMCWGFECGDGWFDVVWQLSLAIEDELGYTSTQEDWFLLKKGVFRRWNKFIYWLSPVRHDKSKMVKGDDNVYRRVVTEKAKPTWDERIVRFLFGETRKLGKFEVQRLGLKRLIHHPNTGFAVDQVKEKFGGLRFYSPGNDRIYHLVDLAERACSLTCEECGKYAKLRCNRGWYSTLCDGCQEQRHPTKKEQPDGGVQGARPGADGATGGDAGGATLDDQGTARAGGDN